MHPLFVVGGACSAGWPARVGTELLRGLRRGWSEPGEAKAVGGRAGGGAVAEVGGWATGEGWGWGKPHHVDAGLGAQRLHGPGRAQRPIATGGLAMAAPQAA